MLFFFLNSKLSMFINLR